jgi:hypothetical protein
VDLFLKALKNEESIEMFYYGLEGMLILSENECVPRNRQAECVQVSARIAELYLCENAKSWDLQMRVIASLILSRNNVPRVSDANISIALGCCMRGLYLAKKATAVESGAIVARAITSAREILKLVFEEALNDKDAMEVAERVFADLVTIARSEEDGILNGSINCEYKNVHESLVSTIASLELCNTLVEFSSETFRKSKKLMKEFKDRFCPIVEATLEKRFFSLAEVEDFAQRKVVLQTFRIIVEEWRNDGAHFEDFIKMSISRLSSSLEGEMPPWLRVSSVEILKDFCANDKVCTFLHEAYCDPNTVTDDADDAETPFASICLILGRIVQAGLSSTNDSANKNECVYDVVQSEFEKKMSKLSITKDNSRNNIEHEDISNNIENTNAYIARAVTISIESLLTVAKVIEEMAFSDNSSETRFQSAKKMLDAVWETLASIFSLSLDLAENESTCLYLFEAYQNAGRAAVKAKHKLAREAFLGTLCHFALQTKKQKFDENEKAVPRLSLKNALSLRAIFNIVDASEGKLFESWFMVLETIASLERTLGVADKTLRTRVREYLPTGLKPSNWTGAEYEYKEEFYVFSEAAQDMFNSMNVYENDDLMYVVDALIKANIRELREARALAESNNNNISKKKQKVNFEVRLRNLERLRAVIEVNASTRFALFWDVCSKHFCKIILEESGHSREQAYKIFEKIAVNILATDLDADEKNVAYAKTAGGFETVECCVVSYVKTFYESSRDYRGKQIALSIAHAIASKRANKLKTSWPILLDTLSKVAVNETDADLTIDSFETIKVIESEALHLIGKEYYGDAAKCFSRYAKQKNETNVALSAIDSLQNVLEFFGNECVSNDNATAAKNAINANMTQVRNGIKLNLLTIAGLADFSISPILTYLCESFDDTRLEVSVAAFSALIECFVSRAQLLSKNELKECVQKIVFPSIDKYRKIVKKVRNNDNELLVNMLESYLGNMLRNSLPLLVSIENFDKIWDDVLLFFIDSVISDCEEVSITVLHNFLPILLENDEGNGGMPKALWKKTMKTLHAVTEKVTAPTSLATQSTRIELATLFGTLFERRRDSFDVADSKGTIRALQQLINSPCVGNDVQPLDGALWDVQKRALKSMCFMCAKSKEGKNRTLICIESINVLLQEMTRFGERQSTQTAADLAFARLAMEAFYEIYDIVANDETSLETFCAAMTAISKLARRRNNVQAAADDEDDDKIVNYLNYNTILLQKAALQALVVVSRRGVASLSLSSTLTSGISARAAAKSDWSAAADAFETVLGQNVEIMSSNDDNDDEQEAMLTSSFDDDQDDDFVEEVERDISLRVKKSRTFSSLTIIAATALGQVVLRQSATAEDDCIQRFLRSLARGCKAPRIDIATESYAQLCDLARFSSYSDLKNINESVFAHRARVATFAFPRVVSCTKKFLEEHANACTDSWTFDTTRDALRMCSTLAVSVDVSHSKNTSLNAMLQKARESKGSSDDIKDEELVLGVFVFSSLSKCASAAVEGDIQELAMFALLGSGKYLGIM